VLLISVLDALRPSFEDNSVSDLVAFYRVVARSMWSFPESGSAYALCCCLARRSTKFIGSCKIYNLMSFDDICNKVFLSPLLSPLCCLIAFEHGPGCFLSIRVL
jgi:hypothetical protein